MALVVEDGSVVSGSNSYISVADTDTYWEARSNSTWAAASDEEKERALLDAARYLDYGYKWLGTRLNSTQIMTWPRYMPWLDADDRFIASNVIPLRVKDAQCELALQSLTASLMPTLEGAPKESSISVGPLSVSYFRDAEDKAKVFTVVDLLLTDLIATKRVGGLTADAVLA